MYAGSIADAEARGDDGMAEKQRSMGPPPYDDTLDYPIAIAIASKPKWLNVEHGADYHVPRSTRRPCSSSEHTLIEQLRGWAAIAETFHVLHPQLVDTDFWVDVPRLDVPVYIVEGRYEAAGRETLAADWWVILEQIRPDVAGSCPALAGSCPARRLIREGRIVPARGGLPGHQRFARTAGRTA